MDGVNIDDIEENTFNGLIDSTVKTDSGWYSLAIARMLLTHGPVHEVHYTHEI